MALLQTYKEGKLSRLTSLKYGEMGQTGGPLVSKPIPLSGTTTPPETTEVSARVDDVVRISKLLKTPPGIKWTLNNTALSAFSVPKKGSKTGVGNLISSIGGGLVSTLGTVGSTLAQVAVNGTGTHFVKGFIGVNKKYLDKSRQTGVTKEAKYGMGRPGAGGYSPSRTEYTESDFIQPTGQSDTISTEGIKTSHSDFDTETKDFVKFIFGLVTPGGTSYFRFRAYLKSFDDSYRSNWNSYNYVGRGENFYTYKAFNRDVNFTFMIAAQTRQELKPIYEKLSVLASSTAPYYNEEGYMAGTIGRITIGDYLVDQPGFFESVRYSWDEDYQWEIQSGAGMRQLPTVLRCSVSFTPIHTFIPQAESKYFITSPTEKWHAEAQTVQPVSFGTTGLGITAPTLPTNLVGG